MSMNDRISRVLSRLLKPLFGLSLLSLLPVACDRGPASPGTNGPGPTTSPSPATAPASAGGAGGTGGAAAALFTEITREVGLPADPPRYPDGTYMTPEITPGGVALLDVDNDGRLDIL